MQCVRRACVHTVASSQQQGSIPRHAIGTRVPLKRFTSETFYPYNLHDGGTGGTACTYRRAPTVYKYTCVSNVLHVKLPAVYLYCGTVPTGRYRYSQ